MQASPTTTRFTRTRLSDIVHPVSSSQLTQDPDRVRSFGGYNTTDGNECVRMPRKKRPDQVVKTARTVGNVGSHPPSRIWTSSQFRKRLPSTLAQGSSGESR